MEFALNSPVWWGGAALWLAGMSLWLYSLARLIRANPNGVIPQFWGRPERFPKAAYWWRVAGSLLIFVAIFLWAEALGWWLLLFGLATLAPMTVINTCHNRRVRRRRTVSSV